MFIDDPGPFGTLSEWEHFLAEMRETRPRDALVRKYIALAEEWVSDLREAQLDTDL